MSTLRSSQVRKLVILGPSFSKMASALMEFFFKTPWICDTIAIVTSDTARTDHSHHISSHLFSFVQIISLSLPSLERSGSEWHGILSLARHTYSLIHSLRRYPEQQSEYPESLWAPPPFRCNSSRLGETESYLLRGTVPPASNSIRRFQHIHSGINRHSLLLPFLFWPSGLQPQAKHQH